MPWNVGFHPTKFAASVGFVFAANKDQVTCISYNEGVFRGDFKGLPHLPTKAYADFLEKNVDKVLKQDRIAA